MGQSASFAYVRRLELELAQARSALVAQRTKNKTLRSNIRAYVQQERIAAEVTSDGPAILARMQSDRISELERENAELRRELDEANRSVGAAVRDIDRFRKIVEERDKALADRALDEAIANATVRSARKSKPVPPLATLSECGGVYDGHGTVLSPLPWKHEEGVGRVVNAIEAKALAVAYYGPKPLDPGVSRKVDFVRFIVPFAPEDGPQEVYGYAVDVNLPRLREVHPALEAWARALPTSTEKVALPLRSSPAGPWKVEG